LVSALCRFRMRCSCLEKGVSHGFRRELAPFILSCLSQRSAVGNFSGGRRTSGEHSRCCPMPMNAIARVPYFSLYKLKMIQSPDRGLTRTSELESTAYAALRHMIIFFKLRWGWVFLERTRILSGIQFTMHSIEFFVVEAKRFVGSFVNVILRRQTCGQRSGQGCGK